MGTGHSDVARYSIDIDAVLINHHDSSIPVRFRSFAASGIRDSFITSTGTSSFSSR